MIRRPSGKWAWILQRATAIALIGFALSHFALQHFTASAVSTALLATHRFSQPGWQVFYTLFLACALFHGLNGTWSVILDRRPGPALRKAGIAALLVVGLLFGALGLKNIYLPAHSVASLKAWYAANGFPNGTSAGHPPNPLLIEEYRFGADEMRELHLLALYLEHHTHRTEAEPASIGTIFGAQHGSDAAAGGAVFDAWLLSRIAGGAPVCDCRNTVFSSTADFALWAANVRKANAAQRGDAAILERLAGVPAYRAEVGP